jgi:GMP synthase-like glutamine amidotransferase
MAASALFIDLWPDAHPRGVWRERFRDVQPAAAAHGLRLEVVHHDDVDPDEWSARAPSAIMLSGSRTNLVDTLEEDPEEGALLGRFARVAALLERLPTTPVLGICFGHQYLAKLSGGRLERMTAKREDNDFAISPLEADPLLAGLPAEPRLVENHLWRVVEPGRGYRVVATSQDGIEMVRHAGLPRVGVQFHPEYFARQPADRAHGRTVLSNWFRGVAAGVTP